MPLVVGWGDGDASGRGPPLGPPGPGCCCGVNPRLLPSLPERARLSEESPPPPAEAGWKEMVGPAPGAGLPRRRGSRTVPGAGRPGACWCRCPALLPSPPVTS